MMLAASASVCVLNFSTNSVAPEKAIWFIYLSTSSLVMPIPLSRMVRVFFFLSTSIFIVRSPSSPLNSPADARVLSLFVASTALLTISRRNISFSEYKNFLITGKMFSVFTPIEPVCISIYFYLLIFFCRGNVKQYAMMMTLTKRH